MGEKLTAEIKKIFDDKGRVFNYRPLVICAIAFGIGICASKAIGIAGSLVGAALFAFLLIVGYLIGFRRAALFLFVMILGVIRFSFAASHQPAEGEYHLAGRVAEEPAISADRAQLILNDITLNGTKYYGRIQLTVSDGKAFSVNYGDRIHADVEISSLSPAMNDGGIDLNTYYRGMGIIALANTTFAEVHEGKTDFYGLCLNLRTELIRQIEDLYPKHHGIVAGLLLGEKDGIPGRDLQSFRDTGAAHLLAVSGLHIAIFAAAVSKMLGRYSPRVRFFILGAFLLIYCAVTGFAPSVVRASVMTMTAVLAEVTEHRYDAPSALAMAFLLILIVQPFALFQAGFQLSFSAVAGILLLQPIFAELLKNVFLPLREAVSVSLAASLGILPATVSTFYRLPLLGLFANLLVVPLVPMILLPALISVCLNGILPPVARIIAFPVKGLLEILLAVIRFVADIPGGVLHVAVPNAFALILFAVACVLISVFFLRPLRTRLVCAGIALLLCAACCVLPSVNIPQTQIIALYQPYGGALILKNSDAVILLHPGSGEYTPSADWLAHNGITEIDAVFVKNSAQANAAAMVASDVTIDHVLLYGGNARAKEILMENYLLYESFETGEKMTLNNELSVTMEDALWVDIDGLTICIGESARNASIRFGAGEEGSYHTDGMYISTGGTAVKQSGHTLYLSETGQLTLLPEEGKIRVRAYQSK